ncbi:MAG TPA: hypothetical protein VKJ00_06260 [Thermoanaerobaculia bacterium]|nr:hypothetical protein [Thermoanaerobaculia bacterium]
MIRFQPDGALLRGAEVRREVACGRRRSSVAWLLLGLALVWPGALRGESGTTPKEPGPQTVPARRASDGVLVPAAHGDWPVWRGNPQHTGLQSVPGRIQAPAVQWRYRLGGQLMQQQAVLCSSGSTSDMLLIAPAGHLAAYDLNGRVLWESRPPLQLNLLGCWDFGADGRSELLASSAGYTDGQLFLFDTSNGTMIWSGPPAPGNVGAVKVLNLDSTPALELLWLPAASSTLYAYTFVSGVSRPSLLWSSTIQNFVSDPYTFSSIGVTSPTSGSRRIVVSGARHQIPEIVIDANNGAELARTVFDGIIGLESGGTGQLLQLKDVDGSGVQRIINVASYDSSAGYMFHGASVANASNLREAKILDTAPVGLRYVQGSVADFDGDGRDEILVSRYLPESDRHDLLLLSAADFTAKAVLPNFYLSAITDLGDGQGPLIIGSLGVTTEYPFGTEGLVAYRYTAGAFHQTAWKSGVAPLATVPARSFDQPDRDNPGDSAVVLKTSSGGSAFCSWTAD